MSQREVEEYLYQVRYQVRIQSEYSIVEHFTAGLL
jgi:hypothetical protein